MSIEERLNNLENLMNSIISMIGNDCAYDSAEKEGMRQIEADNSHNINTNTNDIADNRQGIEESFESSLTNSDDIADVRTALEEVYELIANEEE